MNIYMQEKYATLLKDKFEKGLNVLKRTSIGGKKYQSLVVNLNNTSNIIYQIESAITAEKAKIEKQDTAAKDVTVE